MNGLTQKERYNMEDLLEIVALLRDPENGCPWDKVQTHTSIRKNFIEETYEVADAIDLADASLLCEELGDVLLQVALHTRMEEEQGAFTFGDVCTGICKKLIYRHPHIFGDAGAQTPDEALQNWEALKRREKHREGAGDDLDSVPAALPALMRSRKVAKRAADHGFTYPDAQGCHRGPGTGADGAEAGCGAGQCGCAAGGIGRRAVFCGERIALSGLRRGRGAGRRNGEICAALQGNGTPGRPAGLRGG